MGRCHWIFGIFWGGLRAALAYGAGGGFRLEAVYSFDPVPVDLVPGVPQPAWRVWAGLRPVRSDTGAAMPAAPGVMILGLAFVYLPCLCRGGLLMWQWQPFAALGMRGYWRTGRGRWRGETPE